MNTIEAIESRHSVRTFSPMPVTHLDIRKIADSLSPALLPINGRVAACVRRFDSKGSLSPGTYGTISGAEYYILLATDGTVESLMAGGFLAEGAVLTATALGLGTCWIAGTLRKSDFDVVEWPDGLTLTAIIAVGWPAEKKRVRDSMTRWFLRSHNRKPFGKMFFYSNFDTPLESAGIISDALSMMRLAPSSKNSQPWRALVGDGTVHFYCLEPDLVYVLDSGIGLRHFSDIMVAEGWQGCFYKDTSAPQKTGLRYLISYRLPSSTAPAASI